jgi:NADH:ubiquinone oxidoreductase subunit F (NADH-binding)
MTATTVGTADAVEAVDAARRLLPALPPSAGSPATLAAHLALHPALTVPPGDDPVWGARIRRAVAESGLFGRGGAGFPTGAKWSPASTGRRRAMVVVNAMEGEPASAKDRVLLERAPHLVLDGAEVAAAVIGASDIVICVADRAHGPASSVERAIAERERAGTAGRRMSVQRPPGRYVTGEESALVGWLGNRRPLPVLRIDKSVPLEVARRPVLVHNAETLAQVALVARYGPQWFRRLGTLDAPGSTLVTVTGAVRTPAVLEVEYGTPIDDIVRRAGVTDELSAALIGGYGGAWLDGSDLSTAYAPGPMAAIGASCGVGIVVALPAGSCGIAETARVARYLAQESAGQCGPCVFGLAALADDLETLWAGSGDGGVVARIGGRAAQIEGRGACRHPDGAVRLVRSALTVFADDVRLHASGRPCRGHTAPSVLTFPEEYAPTGRAR